MADNLTPSQIVEWFREQARVFNQMATTIENTFKMIPPTNGAESPALSGMGTFTPAMLRSALAEKAMRVATIAKQFNVREYDVEKAIDSADSCVVRGRKGWITIKGSAFKSPPN